MAWISPTGFTASDWTTEEYAYDANTETTASYLVVKASWSPYLILTFSEIDCDKVQIWSSGQTADIDTIEIDYYDTGWVNFASTALVQGSYQEYAIGSTVTITEIRIRYYNSKSNASRLAYCHEAQLNEIGGGVQALLSTATITTSFVSALSRGATEALTSTSNIVSSITGALTRGITQVLNSASAITSSITGLLSRGVTETLTSTSVITSSITGSLSRGVTETLISISNIVTSITGILTKEGNPYWLSGWDKRIKLTVDASKIDADLTWFPVTVHLTATQAEEVFTELTTDAEYLKVAFTKADGVTELYAEMEMFDVSELKGIFHVSRDGWVIDDTVNTDFYMYYDKDHADNTTYIGAINTTAGAAVWDGNFKAVYHMVDDTTSTVLDSTGNNNDGTKKGANEPVEATGQVGQAQDFDGSDDYLRSGTTLDYSTMTIEFITLITRADMNNATTVLFDKADLTIGTNYGYYVYFSDSDANPNRLGFYVERGSNGGVKAISSIMDSFFNSDDPIYAVVTFDASVEEGIELFRNGVKQTPTATDWDPVGTHTASTLALGIGSRSVTNSSYVLNGGMDENRISSSVRADAWLKATYNSLWDTLLTYGSEAEKHFLISTSAIATSITGSLSRGVTQTLISTVNIVSSFISRITKIIQIVSTSAIVTSITSSLSRGVKETLNSTSAITTSFSAKLTRIMDLVSTSAIVVSITASLSRGITETLTSAVTITTSIISALSRGITQALLSTVNGVVSFTGNLSRGIKEALTSTSNIAVSIVAILTKLAGETQYLLSTAIITSSITSSLSRGITETLTSVTNIVTSFTGSLSRGISEALTSTVNIATSISGALSRGITQTLISTSNIVISITSSLGRGIKETLTSTVNIAISISGILSKVGAIALNSVAAIVCFIGGKVDVGSPAINRLSTVPNLQTYVIKDNPADNSGKITSIEIWANENLSNCKVATFFVVSGNNLSTRDTYTIGDVAAGYSKHTVNLNVNINDYIGIYFSAGKVDMTDGGGVGYWVAYGDKIPCTNVAFDWNTSERILSLYGTGTSGVSLGRGIKETLISTSAIVTSITSTLSRGIKEVLLSASNITTSITTTLSRGITEALTSTSVIMTSMSGNLSRGIKEVLTSTATIVTSITSTLSSGILRALNSTVNIVSSITANLKAIYHWAKVAKVKTDWTKVEKGKDDWILVSKEKGDMTKVSKEKDDWTKVNKTKGDMNKVEKE